MVALALLLVVARAQAQKTVTVVWQNSANGLLRDRIGTALTPGTTAGGDGVVLQLGYYTKGTASNPFHGIFVALTGEGSANSDFQSTSIGDLAGGPAGQLNMVNTFTEGSTTTGADLPTAGTPLVIRFYDGTTIAASTSFNDVSGGAKWAWISPSESPGSLVLISLSESGLVWRGGTASSFAATVSKTQAVIPSEKSSDLNGDGFADLLFQNNIGQIYAWYMDGNGIVSLGAYLFTGGLGDWRVVGRADMDNDGNADLVFQNTIGQIYVWYMNGNGAISSSGYLFTSGLGDWRVMGIADLDNDGNADLVFQNTVGQIYAWYMNGNGAISSSGYLFTNGLADWRIAGIADLDNDGNADLVFQNTVGQIYAWYMDGSGSISSSGYLFTGDLADWRVVAIADMDGDGNADLVFQNNIGQIYAWYMDESGVISSSGYLFTGGLGEWRMH
jgi:hypothetical protein